MEDDIAPKGGKEYNGEIPDQKDLEKELSDYLSKKYGGRIKIISPLVMPKTDDVSSDEPGKEDKSGGAPAFDMLPEELESYLDSFVVKQDRAKAVLATKICTHFNRIKHSKESAGCKNASRVGMIKNNVLMIGPTGVGKTYVIKLIAQKLGVPFVKGDATKFSETGYVGGDVEDLVRDLAYEANEDLELAENGIIYIDEIDKIASSQNIIGHDVSRTGVQRALLKPMEETDVDMKVAHDPISQIQAIEHYRKTGKREKKQINTKNILFIMSGAFGELAKIIRERLQSQGLGFEADVRSAEIPWEILKEVAAQDLISFGFESEFVGRLPVVVVFDELTKEDLIEILKNPNNPIIISKRLDTLGRQHMPKCSPFAYCPCCGAAEPDRTRPKKMHCLDCGFSFYFNVAAAVAALIVHDGQVLVTRRKYPPAAGTLDLPGGFVDPGETARKALQREIHEELNLRITRADYFCSLPNRYPYGGMEYRTLDLAFVCRVTNTDALEPGDDVAGCRWIPVPQLQPRDFGLQSIKRLVAKYRHFASG